jgi:hypothetical protein
VQAAVSVGAPRHPADAVGAAGVGRPVRSVLGKEGRQDAPFPDVLPRLPGIRDRTAACGDLGQGELARLALTAAREAAGSTAARRFADGAGREVTGASCRVLPGQHVEEENVHTMIQTNKKGAQLLADSVFPVPQVRGRHPGMAALRPPSDNPGPARPVSPACVDSRPTRPG